MTHPEGIPWFEQPRVLSTELLPPDGTDVEPLRAAARQLRDAGAVALFFPDAPKGRSRLDAIVTAWSVRTSLGGPCIPHINARDRNRLALESALLTARMLGVDGAKVVTGDPISSDAASGVYDLDSVGILELGRREAPEFPLFAGHNAGHPDPHQSAKRLAAKVAAGARAVITTPTLDPERLVEALDRLGPLPVPLMVGLMLVPSLEVLEYLLLEVPSFHVPTPVRERIRGARDGEEARRAGLDAALAVANAVGDRARGFHVVPPFGRWQGAVGLLKALA